MLPSPSGPSQKFLQQNVRLEAIKLVEEIIGKSLMTLFLTVTS